MLVNFYSFSAKYYQPLAVLITALVLSACSALTDKQAPEPLLVSNDHQTSIAQLTKWRVTGKIGFITPEERQRANLNWQMNESIWPATAQFNHLLRYKCIKSKFNEW